MAEAHVNPSNLRFVDIASRTMFIVAYLFLYIAASGVASVIGVAVSQLYERLVLRIHRRHFWDSESPWQSLSALLAVLGFLTPAECLFALHMLGRIELSVTDQIVTALFGVSLFAVALSLLIMGFVATKSATFWMLRRTNRLSRTDEQARLMMDYDLESYRIIVEPIEDDVLGLSRGQDQVGIEMRDLPSIRRLGRDRTNRLWIAGATRASD